MSDGLLTNCTILLTGARGFIGQNLQVRLGELQGVRVLAFTRDDDLSALPNLLRQVDVVIHLAAENRPADDAAYAAVNTDLTVSLISALRSELSVSQRNIPLIFTSSTQAELDNPYGRSKRAAEIAIEEFASETHNSCVIYRLPGVFGKWCKPNYNSVVATFCHNIARGLDISVNDPATALSLVYIDDVITSLIDTAFHAQHGGRVGFSRGEVSPVYDVTLGDLVREIRTFDVCRNADLEIAKVGTGLTRALYATYVSYLPADRFSYPLIKHEDARGVFVEMLRTPDCGQFSYFTALPGVTRGGHYHHSKTEKFLVIQGQALFRFRNLLSGDLHELRADAKHPHVVDTIPGWSHDITNIGDATMVVMLWANEKFDKKAPDTISRPIG